MSAARCKLYPASAGGARTSYYRALVH